MLNAVLGGATFGPCGNKNESVSYDHTDGLGVNLFPNPNNGEFTLIIGNVEGPVDVSLFDLNGRMLYNETYDGSTPMLSKQINMTGLAPGMYILRASDERGDVSEKVQVE